MKLITVIWKERGYSASFWASASCAAGDARRIARSLIAAARRENPGVYRVRVKIGGLQ